MTSKDKILQLYPGSVEMSDPSGSPSADYCIMRPATKEDWPENKWVQVGPYVSGNPWDAAAGELFPKTCPFCGSEPEEVHGNDRDYFYVYCSNEQCPCQPETGMSGTEEEARRQWNERAN